jgi:3-methyl-2-oxobutanoate hydroxymethyltransferase
MTVPKFTALKPAGRKITVVTAYDYMTAGVVDAAGIEGILVGDSLGMVVQGHPTTLPVTLDQIIYHAEIVGRAVEQALVIVDLPFPTDRLGAQEAVRSAARILKETRCQAVKLEGGVDQPAIIAALVSAGIPVMAHCGLRPQSVHQLGGYRVQRDGVQLMAAAKAAEAAGAFAIVLELVPADVAAAITAALAIPTIGIGAGVGCDGQVLVVNDLLGLSPGRLPRHVKTYANLRATILDAVIRFREDVRQGAFPGDEQTFR